VGPCGGAGGIRRGCDRRWWRWKEEEEEDFVNHYKNDLKRRAHTLPGVEEAKITAKTRHREERLAPGLVEDIVCGR